jgi:hypothetical protein
MQAVCLEEEKRWFKPSIGKAEQVLLRGSRPVRGETFVRYLQFLNASSYVPLISRFARLLDGCSSGSDDIKAVF